jgi:hypothetical protein
MQWGIWPIDAAARHQQTAVAHTSQDGSGATDHKEPMMIDIDEVFRTATDGTRLRVTLVTNAETGLVSYATGIAKFVPAEGIGPFRNGARLSTKGMDGLIQLFSDRRGDVNQNETPPAGSGGFGSAQKLQPFWIDNADRIEISLGQHLRSWLPGGVASANTYSVRITFTSWGNGSMSVGLQPLGQFLVGAAGPKSQQTGFMFSFAEAEPLPR